MQWNGSSWKELAREGQELGEAKVRMVIAIRGWGHWVRKGLVFPEVSEDYSDERSGWKCRASDMPRLAYGPTGA